jgi:hypothetical protein
MKQWLSAHILSSEDFIQEDTFPISREEFYISLSMVGIALVLFTVIVHLL